MRYKLTLSYSGAGFCGWQIQPSAPSVQGTIQKALSTLLGEAVTVTGAGRTDTGVNARDYVAHFDCSHEVETEVLKYKINAILPNSIVIHELAKADENFHARFDARRREYTYYLHRSEDPFSIQCSHLCTWPELGMEKMNQAASKLLGTHDFSCFEKTGADNKTSICTVFEACWQMDDQQHWSFHIAADRFLRNMVRAIVGTLIDVGRGKRSPESIDALLARRDRCAAGESVPGDALFLTKIEY